MRERSYDKCPIAIIGMSCRFPGAGSLRDLWSMLVDGRDGFRPLDERWNATLVRPRKSELTPPVPRAGLLDSIAGFDAPFFGISPREAERMDPQQRFVLELTWEAFEDAGIPPERYAGERVGVFVGSSSSDYWSLTTDSAHRTSLDAWTALGGSPSILANRVSYSFDFRGPSVALDSACSASLYAVHMAKESLRSGESALAVASGVGLLVRPENTLSFAQAHMLSPTGESRPFGDATDGFVRGEGCGCVILKRLDDALAAGDRVHAIIRGSATSQDGRSPGITVPTVAGQVRMLQLAYADARVEPRRVAYVEAHGTGTPTGDPIEAQALGEVIGKGRPADQPCLIGSIKSNIGHLEGGAGIAGLIKAALCLEHDRIPPTLSWARPSAEIPFEDLRLRIADRVQTLRANGESGFVGVSAFGFGGTNVHVVLEGAPRPEHEMPATEQRPHLLPLSARDERAVRDFAKGLAEHVDRADPGALGDVAHTLAAHRSAHAHRVAFVAETSPEASEQLRGCAGGERPVAKLVEPAGEITFVFSGMGPQWWGMGRELMSSEPTFRASVERVDAAFARLSGTSILARVFSAAEGDVPSLVEQADLGHPAHFALQYGLCELLSEWGIVPSAVVGHSAGEVSAALASGVLSFDDAIRVLYHRSKLVQTCAGLGNMLAAALSREEADALVASTAGAVCIGAVNGPRSVALSGPRSILERIATQLEAANRFARIIPGCFAYHSSAFDRIQEELARSLVQIQVLPSRTRAVSTVSGTWIQGNDFGASYWARNVRDCVEFESALESLMADGRRTFVEIGAHPALLASIREILEGEAGGHAIATLRREGDERRAMLRCAGDLWEIGHPVRLAEANGSKGRLTDLPSYRWQHGSYWVKKPVEIATDADAHPVLGVRVASDHPTWQARVLESQPVWARDHRIHEQVLLPAVSWLEAWLSATLEEGSELPISLEQIRFSKICALTDQPTWLRTRRLGDRWTLESGRSPADFAWVLHGSARRSRQHAWSDRIELDALRSALEHERPDYGAFAQLGYNYGPRYRTITELWRTPERALARLSVSGEQDPDASRYVLDPGLIDGALQLLLSLAAPLDGLYLPVSIDEVTLHRRPAPATEVWADARLRAREAGELSADFAIFTSDGAPLLVARGARATRVGRGRLFQAPVMHRETWVRASESLDLPMSMVRLAPAMLLDPGPYSEPQGQVHGELDELAAAFFSEALDALGARQVSGPIRAVEAALADGRIVPSMARFARHMAQSLPQTIRSSEKLRRELAQQSPGWHLEQQLIQRFGEAMPDLLRGDSDPRELLLSSAHGVGSLLYSDSETWRSSHLLLRSALEREQAAFEGKRMLRVLEIGGGTGSAAAWLLPKLDPDRTEFVFTDVSQAFLREARERFQFPFLSTALLDIERDPEAQGIPLHRFDVVIASSVLHATKDLRDTLANCRKLLTDSGLLLLSEPVHPVRWFDFVFGTFDGWWRFEDSQLRHDHPLISADEWESLLLEAGFADAGSLATAPGAVLAVIAARADVRGGAPETQRLPEGVRWLVVSDDVLGEQLAARLESAGREATLARFSDAQASASAPAFQRVVFAPSLGSGESALHGLLDLSNGLKTSTQLTIVTRCAQRVPSEATPRNTYHAALWGFARVLTAERADLEIRLLDLGMEYGPLDAASILHEIDCADRAGAEREAEVAIRGVLRFVPRVAHATVDRLEPLARGQRSDEWCPVEVNGDASGTNFRSALRRPPAADEIELRVSFHALTGGALAECSGVVSRVGHAVSEFAVGERVAGVIPGEVGRSYLTASALLFTNVPEHLSLQEAAAFVGAAGTAELALSKAAHLRMDETLLVRSCAGPIATAALLLAKQIGAQVIVASDGVSDTGGQGVDVILGSLGSKEVLTSLDLLRSGGRFVAVDVPDPEHDASLVFGGLGRNRSLHIVDLEDLVRSKPDLVGRLLRSAFERLAASAAHPLPYVQLPVDRIHEAGALRAAHRQSCGIVLDCGESPRSVGAAAPGPLRFGPAGSYLITGGLGGFGIATARWLARRGARHLVLAGRSGAAGDAELAVAQLRGLGVRVEVRRVDVSRGSEVTRLIEWIESQMPPLKGVFHAAMVLDDVPVSWMTKASLEKVFGPKAAGAWELHLATSHLSLDHFVLFSSMSRMIGVPGQANYVAANEFLAALADLRRSAGKPATCIDWGMIGDVGYVARNERILKRFVDSGVHPLGADEALEIMEQALAAGAEHVGAARIDWSRLDRLLPMQQLPARFTAVRAQSSPVAPAEACEIPGLETILRGAGPVEREAAALAFVGARAAAILRCKTEDVPTDLALVRVGFDSLMEVELRASIQKDAGVELPSSRATRGASLRILARRVLDQLGHGTDAESATAEVSPDFVRWLEVTREILGDAFAKPAAPGEIERLLNETMTELNARVGHLDADQHRAHREAFYPRLARFFLEGATLRRAHDKPLGYPGDYLLMKHMYGNVCAGEGVAAAVDAFGLALAGAQAVRNRAPYLHHLLEQAARGKPTLRVVSVGCGPAWEIRTLDSEKSHWAAGIDLLLVDQDQGALTDCQAALEGRAAPRSIEFLCAPVDELASDGSLARQRIGSPDLLYSTGLFDYFSAQTFRQYLKALYGLVRPGGTLVIGNLSSRNPNRWLVEYACDWFLYHRTEDELAAFARALEPAPVSVKVEAEPLGVNLFLVLERPA